MNLQQASMKDRSAATWKERKQMYKVGSPMKGCHNCGEIEVTETGKVRYLSGFQVFRSYSPSWTGWTYWCWECSAKDHACWENASDVGLEPVVGCRDAVRAIKNERRKAAQQALPKGPSRAAKIAELEAEIERLKVFLKAKEQA